MTMGFHVRLKVGNVMRETGKESFSSSGSLQLTPEAPQIAAHSECNHPEVQNQVEELNDDNNEPMRPADTEEIPEKKDYQSVPYLGGKEQELKSERTLEMKIKVGDNFGGNSGSEDGVW